jgi:muconolactone delta-isomerase
MEYTEDPILIDIVVGNSNSCVFDSGIYDISNREMVKKLLAGMIMRMNSGPNLTSLVKHFNRGKLYLSINSYKKTP